MADPASMYARGVLEQLLEEAQRDPEKLVELLEEANAKGRRECLAEFRELLPEIPGGVDPHELLGWIRQAICDRDRYAQRVRVLEARLARIEAAARGDDQR